MMYESELMDRTVKDLFKKKYSCMLSVEYLSMLRDIPEEIDISSIRFINSGTNPTNGVTRIETTENMSGIIDMLYNIPVVTTDMEYMEDIIPMRPEHSTLSIADIAEILWKRGTLKLVNPVDSVEIHEKIGIYIRQVADAGLYDPHYKAPPEEDMEAFKKLYGILNEISRKYVSRGEGNAALAELMKLIAPTISRTNEPETAVMVELSGGSGSSGLVNHFGELTDPYSFKNF